MAKRIRFTSPDATYRSGDIAEFADHAEADHYLNRGTAVLHSGDGDEADDILPVIEAGGEALPATDGQPAHLRDRPPHPGVVTGPVLAQGRVEAHDVQPAVSVVHTTEANDPEQGDKDKGPVDKATPVAQVEKAKADGK